MNFRRFCAIFVIAFSTLLFLETSGVVCALENNQHEVQQRPTIRLSVLKFGTVNWVLETIKRAKLDQKYGVNLAISPLANTAASKIALQSQSADIVVTDWTFVAKRRAKGADFTLVPYSSSAGSLMIPKDSTIKSVADLKGKIIGVAGGPHDKSWLFIRSVIKERAGFDLTKVATIQYGAPPLLWQKALRGEYDAVLNFWHFSARLEAAGFASLLSVKDAMTALGAKNQTSVIGFTFSQKWADGHPKALAAFLAALKDALALLDSDDKAFEAIRPLMRAKDEAMFAALKHHFRAGLIRRPIVMELADIQTLYKVLQDKGGKAMGLPGTNLPQGVIWQKGDVSLPAVLKQAQ